MIKLYNMDNMAFELWKSFPPSPFTHSYRKANLIYADHIFENKDFSWINKYWDDFLAPNGVFCVHTDHKLYAELTLHLRSMESSVWVNDIITVQDWGGVPKNKFPQKHDYILVYAKGKSWHWDSSGIQIPKVVTSKGMNPSGRMTKTPHACWSDLGNFSTMSKERIKTANGKNIQWQKPEKQLVRLFTPFVKKGDLILDPFMGSGTSKVVAEKIGCDYIGIEIDIEVFELAKERLFGEK